MKPMIAILGLLPLLLAPLGAAARTAPPPETRESLVHDGLTRTALVHDFSGGRPAPLVIVLHGAGGNAEITVEMTQFDAVAKREHLIVAYPNGTGRFGDKLLTWNAGHCCAYALRNHVDDVGFVSALIDRLAATRSVDPRRVYVTGLSNGGMMAHRIGMALPDKVAAVATVVGAVFGDEPPAKAPMPVMMIVGGQDHLVPGAGGMPGTPGAGQGRRGARLMGRAGPPADRPFAPADAQAQYWAKADGCGEGVRKVAGAVTEVAYGGCAPGTEVLFVTVADNGHAWPGGRPARAEADPPSQAFDASAAIWSFFSRHAKP